MGFTSMCIYIIIAQ